MAQRRNAASRPSTHERGQMPNHATKSQIFTAFQSLTTEQLSWLRSAGDRLAQCTLFGGALDLIHEALSRLLTGQRKWPLHIDFAYFLMETMRSIAFAERTRIANRPGRTISFDDDTAILVASPSVPQQPDEHLVAAQEREFADRAFDHAQESLQSDQQALGVLNSMRDGLSPRQIRDRCDLSPGQYELARQRVMWRLNASSKLLGAQPKHPAAPASSRASAARAQKSVGRESVAATPASRKQPAQAKRSPNTPKP